jgi:hypothetical protein
MEGLVWQQLVNTWQINLERQQLGSLHEALVVGLKSENDFNISARNTHVV